MSTGGLLEGYELRDDLAKELGVSVETMRRWLRQGRFPRVQLGRFVYVKRSDVKAWMEAGGVDHKRARAIRRGETAGAAI